MITKTPHRSPSVIKPHIVEGIIEEKKKLEKQGRRGNARVARRSSRGPLWGEIVMITPD